MLLSPRGSTKKESTRSRSYKINIKPPQPHKHGFLEWNEQKIISLKNAYQAYHLLNTLFYSATLLKGRASPYKLDFCIYFSTTRVPCTVAKDKNSESSRCNLLRTELRIFWWRLMLLVEVSTSKTSPWLSITIWLKLLKVSQSIKTS